MTTYFNDVNIKIASYTDVKQPGFDGTKAFYHIYSPESLMLRPRDDIYLDLKIKINAPAHLEAGINLLPSLKGRGFKTEEHKWSTNKLKDDTIQLHILNRSCTYTTYIKKIKSLLICFYEVKKLLIKLLLNIVLLYNFFFVYPN